MTNEAKASNLKPFFFFSILLLFFVILCLVMVRAIRASHCPAPHGHKKEEEEDGHTHPFACLARLARSHARREFLPVLFSCSPCPRTVRMLGKRKNSLSLVLFRVLRLFTRPACYFVVFLI